MHSMIEAGILKTRTRPGSTAGRAGLVWRGLPDRAAEAAAAAPAAAAAWSWVLDAAQVTSEG